MKLQEEDRGWKTNLNKLCQAFEAKWKGVATAALYFDDIQSNECIFYHKKEVDTSISSMSTNYKKFSVLKVATRIAHNAGTTSSFLKLSNSVSNLPQLFWRHDLSKTSIFLCTNCTTLIRLYSDSDVALLGSFNFSFAIAINIRLLALVHLEICIAACKRYYYRAALTVRFSNFSPQLVSSLK